MSRIVIMATKRSRRHRGHQPRARRRDYQHRDHQREGAGRKGRHHAHDRRRRRLVAGADGRRIQGFGGRLADAEPARRTRRSRQGRRAVQGGRHQHSEPAHTRPARGPHHHRRFHRRPREGRVAGRPQQHHLGRTNLHWLRQWSGRLKILPKSPARYCTNAA